jgi:SAM-dependent methyltransferase
MVAECCYSGEYAEFFSERAARRTAHRYLRRGLRGSARGLVDAVAAADVVGATVLEVGGGVGGVAADLLERGAAAALNVELSPSWEGAAAHVLARKGLEGRVDRRVGDFVALAEALPKADVVLLHRVLCCYPDWPAMLGAAMSRSRQLVAFTVPTDRWATRAVVTAGNALLRARGREFRAFVHPIEPLRGALAADGFRIRSDRSGVVWRTVTAERGAPSPRTRVPPTTGQ